MDNPYLDAARRGAALLDTTRPGWRSAVDVQHLKMDSYVTPSPYTVVGPTGGYQPCAACILGWVFWRDTLQWNGALAMLGLRAFTVDAADHGFVIPDDVYEQTDDEVLVDHWELLLSAWQTVLAEEVPA